MDDQAALLRRKVEALRNKKQAKTICILSGKGGVGKSNIAVNFALELIQYRKKVLIMDLDIGMGNIDILLGMQSKMNIYDMFQNHNSVFDIIEKGKIGLDVIAGGTALNDFLCMDDEKKAYFIHQFSELVSAYDYIIFDMGAGIDPNHLFFYLAADELFVITTPEPTAITDAYSVIKQLVYHQAQMPIYVIMNRCITKKTGDQALTRFDQIIHRFLQVEIMKMGSLPEDQEVRRAVMDQLPYIFNEKSPVTKALKRIVFDYLHPNTEPYSRKPTFIHKLKQMLNER